MQILNFFEVDFMKKNDIFEIEITGTTAEGQGVGRAEGMAVFVPFAAVGDLLQVLIVKVTKQLAYGKILEVLQPAPSRITPQCPVFGKCGGCVYRHIEYSAELQQKQQRVADCFTRIGGLQVPLKPILHNDRPAHYRNKAQYPVLAQNGKVTYGFYAQRSHRIVPCDDCALQPPEFSVLAGAVCAWAQEVGVPVYDETAHKGILRHIYLRKAQATGQIMVAVVATRAKLPKEELLIQKIRSTGLPVAQIVLNINPKDTNVILGEQCRTLYGQEYITDELCGLQVNLSPLSFYQVNRDMAERLYQKAAEYAQPEGKVILDLYCGAGLIGLSMAKNAKKLIGVEIVPQAVENAKQNAAQNGIQNAEFLCADATKAAAEFAKKGIKPDVVILDPPRKGITPELVKTVANDFAPQRVVYISCDPATLARDCKLFAQVGYTVTEATPADLFPRTAHCESVALLVRTDPAI